MSDRHFGSHPPDGRPGWENQCARCGSSATRERCTDLHCDHNRDVDDDGDLLGPCPSCAGDGGWWVCLSGEKWCKDHPIQGREKIKRGEIEWFYCDEHPDEEGK